MSAGAFLSPFRRGIVASVQPRLRGDAVECLHHETFLTTQLAFTLAALVAIPLYLGLVGKPDLAAATLFALSMGPALSALYVSRTGRIEEGRILAGLVLTAICCTLAGTTGGLGSPFLALLAVLPAQATLARTRLSAIAVAAAPFAGLAALSALAALAVAPAGAAPVMSVLATAVSALLVALMSLGAGRFIAKSQPATDIPAAGPEETFEEAPDLIARLRRSGNVLSANRAAERMLRTPAEDLVGEGLIRRVHVQDRPVYLQALDAAFIGGSAVAALRLNDGAGGFEEVELRVRRIGERRSDADLVGVFRSVQARVESDAALRTALDAAERASIGKGQLLANMSHELRTPLNAILGFSEILADELVGKLEQEKHREYARLIHESGSHLLDVVNAILDMSKLETGRFQVFPEPFSLDRALRKCCQLMEPQARQAGVTLDVDGLGADDEVTADPRAVKQILLNLISNAVKFSAHGGKVVVGAYRKDDGCLAVYVADEGSGIAADDIERLGEPFLQLKRGYAHGGGTGLGLSVVRGLAQLHDGTMRIESQLGVGTRVTVVIPQQERRAAKVVPVVHALAGGKCAANAPDRLTA